jgi:hypothetical protein
MHRRERADGLSTAGSERLTESRTGCRAFRRQEQPPAHLRRITIWRKREQLLNQDVTLVGGPSHQPGAQLSRRKAHDAPQEVRRVGPEGPRASQRLDPYPHCIGFRLDSHRTKLSAAWLQPSAQQRHGSPEGPHEHGQGRNALLLSPALVPLQRMQSERVTVRLQRNMRHVGKSTQPGSGVSNTRG